MYIFCRILLKVVECAILLLLVWLFVIGGRTDHPLMGTLRKYHYAHRGYHDKPQIPENSMTAFRRAVERGWGAELDVHLMADGTLAVIHDNSLKRTAGAEVCIEDLTLAQLEDYRLEGTSERIPLFRDVLALFEQAQLPLIIELKTTRDNHNALTEAVCHALEGHTAPYCIESFDPRALQWLHKNRPDVVRGQLATKTNSGEVKLNPFIAFACEYLLFNVTTRPDFIAYDYRFRGNASLRFCGSVQRVFWTIRSMDELRHVEQMGAMAIFECFDPDAIEEN